jgi:alpha-tubulin suppressor-like RCC1 family protein
VKRLVQLVAPALLLFGAMSLMASGTTKASAFASTQTDSIWQWGKIVNNQSRNSSTPKEVKRLSGIVAIDSSNNENIVVLSDGTVWDWGNGAYGDLGNGTDNIASAKPVQVMNAADVVTTASGYDYGLGLTSDGHVWAWGFDEHGNLCNGETGTYYTTAFEIPGVSNVMGVAAGGGATVLLLDNGTVETCGSNQHGQLGDGSTGGFSDTPVAVVGLSDVKAVSGADDFEAALTTSGTVYGWGANTWGQLGNGTITSSNVPVQALGITNATQISAGGDTHGNGQTMVVEGNNTIVGYGDGRDGQLCNGTFSSSDRATPVAVPQGVTFVAVASGGASETFLDSNGGVWTCGYNNYGQLGNGTSGTNTDLPGQIDHGADMISSTGNHSLDHHPSSGG